MCLSYSVNMLGSLKVGVSGRTVVRHLYPRSGLIRYPGGLASHLLWLIVQAKGTNRASCIFLRSKVRELWAGLTIISKAMVVINMTCQNENTIAAAAEVSHGYDSQARQNPLNKPKRCRFRKWVAKGVDVRGVPLCIAASGWPPFPVTLCIIHIIHWTSFLFPGRSLDFMMEPS